MNKFKKIKNSIVYLLLGILCLMLLPILCFAQGPPDPNDTPIDGGLSILIAAGVGYGVKKYRNSKK